MDKIDRLLAETKAKIIEIENLKIRFDAYEEDFVYRFYHQSFKLFYVKDLIRDARNLFEKIAPHGTELNPWFTHIVNDGIEKEFELEKTNPNWLSETRPILEAYWHTRYFVNQLARFGRELDKCPQLLRVFCIYIIFAKSAYLPPLVFMNRN